MDRQSWRRDYRHGGGGADRAARGRALLVDHTLATPSLCGPIDHGADIVVHSLTKFLGGHGNSMGGMIVDGGTFNWSRERRTMLCEPRPEYHGVVMPKHSAISVLRWPAACWPCATLGQPFRRSMRFSF